MIKPYSVNESISTVSTPSHWIMEGATSNEVERFSTDSPCLLIDLLDTIERSLKAGNTRDISFLCDLLHLTSTVYALYPQWDLYKQIFVAIIDVFSVSSLPKLVNACLDTISDISEEKLILVIEPEKLQELILRLFDRLQLPEITKAGFVGEVCENSTVVSKSLHILQLIIYTLVYNSANNHQLSLILRNTLKEDNISILLTLGIDFYLVIYDDHYVGKYDLSKDQIAAACSILFNEISLVDVLIHQTSVLTIIKRSRLFNEYKSCLEVISIDTQVTVFRQLKLVASNVINEIINDE